MDHHAVAGNVLPQRPSARQLLSGLRSIGLDDFDGVACDRPDALAPLLDPSGPRVVVVIDIVGANDHGVDIAFAVGLASSE